MKQPNKVGGGAVTNQFGLAFEQVTSLAEALLRLPGITILDDTVYKDGVMLGQLCGKNRLYTALLNSKGVDYKNLVSKKMVPDDAILIDNTVFIIEKKFQSGPGSVDEKLQTCDFKKKQYTKVLATVGLNVEYIYVLNDWFKKPEYNDVQRYIVSVGCHYFFNEIPLSFLGVTI